MSYIQLSGAFRNYHLTESFFFHFVLVVYYILDVIDITLKNGSMEFAWTIILKMQRLPK